MLLTQRNAVYLIAVAALLAVVAVALFQFTRSPLPVAAQQDPPNCDISTVGMSVITNDADGRNITEVSHGTEIRFRVILSIPELPPGQVGCNYGGGRLSITMPDGSVRQVAGGPDGPIIPTIRVGAVFISEVVAYTVDQGDAVDGDILVTANYEGGTSYSGPDADADTQAQLPARLPIAPPEIEIGITPSNQSVYRGGNATFTITVTNNGGFDLSDVRITDSLVTNCDRTLTRLVMNESEAYTCELRPAISGVNRVSVVAEVQGNPPSGQAEVSASARAEVSVEDVNISITMSPDTQNVRAGADASFEVTVFNPNTIGMSEVFVTSTSAPDCERDIGAMAAGETSSYRCLGAYPSGLAEVSAMVTGIIPEIATLTDEAEVVVEVFDLGLSIEKTPPVQTIREGSQASFTINVNNVGGAPLIGVSISDPVSPDCARSDLTLDADETLTYECSSRTASEDFVNEIIISGIAPDGNPVESSSQASVRVLHPNTRVEVTELDTSVLRLVVQVLTITETNTGDSPLSDVYVDVDPIGVRLDKDSKEWIGGDVSADSILDPGETWEWRLIAVSLAGEGIILPANATSVDYIATGHGTDPLGTDITFPAYASEQDALSVPIGN